MVVFGGGPSSLVTVPSGVVTGMISRSKNRLLGLNRAGLGGAGARTPSISWRDTFLYSATFSDRVSAIRVNVVQDRPRRPGLAHGRGRGRRRCLSLGEGGVVGPDVGGTVAVALSVSTPAATRSRRP